MKIYAIYDFSETTTPDLSYIDGIVEQNGSIVHIVYNGIPDDGISEYRVFPENPDNLISGYEHMYSPLSGQPAEYQIISMDDKPVDIKYNIKLPLHGHSARSIVSGILSWARLPFSEEQLNQAIAAAGFGDHNTMGYATEVWVSGQLPSQTEKNRWNTAHNDSPVSIAFVGDTNKKVVLTQRDGSTLETAILDGVSDPDMSDDVINILDYNENNDGVLRAITSEGYAITVSLDGRHSLLGHGHNADEIVTDALRRFVTDTQISDWNSKSDGDHGHPQGDIDFSTSRIDIDGSGGSGNGIEWGITLSDANSSENFPSAYFTVLTAKINTARTFQIGATTSGSFYMRSLHSGNNNTWRQLFHTGNLTPNDYLKRDGSNIMEGELFVNNSVRFFKNQAAGEANLILDTNHTVNDDRDFLRGELASDVVAFNITHRGDYYGNSFKKLGGQNNNILLDGGGTEAVSNFSKKIGTISDVDGVSDGNTTIANIVNGTTSNSPYGNHNGTLFTFGGSGAFQFATTDNSSIGLKFRKYKNWNGTSEWVDMWHSNNFNPDTKANTSTKVLAGTGLDGGGNLSDNRTIGLDSTSQLHLSRGNTAYGWGDHGDEFYLKYSRGSISDFDSSTSVGIYYYTTSSLNSPSSYGSLFNIISHGGEHKSSSNWLTQLAFGTSSNEFFFRKKTNNGAFSSWNEVWNSGNLDPVTRNTSQTITGTKQFNQTIYSPNGFSELSAPSLRKLKENIKPFEKSGLKLTNALRFVTFDYKDKELEDGTKIKGVKNSIGWIVEESPEEFLNQKKSGIDLYKAISIQGKAIQELTEMDRQNTKWISDLQRQNREKDRKIESLEKRLSNLENLFKR